MSAAKINYTRRSPNRRFGFDYTYPHPRLGEIQLSTSHEICADQHVVYVNSPERCELEYFAGAVATTRWCAQKVAAVSHDATDRHVLRAVLHALRDTHREQASGLPVTSRDWCLLGGGKSGEVVAKKLSSALRRCLRKSTPDKAYDAFFSAAEKVQIEHPGFGAYDTEPRAIAWAVIQAHFRAAKKVA